MSWSYFMLIVGEETESAGKTDWTFGRNRISAEIPPLEPTVTAVPFLFACFFCVLVCWRRNVPKSGLLWIFSMNQNVASRPSCPCHFGKCKANHVNRARVFIGWPLPTQVCQSFTRQIRVYQHEKVGEKVGENRGKFYLSPTVCQRVCRLFLSRSHTSTWVCRHEFANFSLPCEGRFTKPLTTHLMRGKGDFWCRGSFLSILFMFGRKRARKLLAHFRLRRSRRGENLVDPAGSASNKIFGSWSERPWVAFSVLN